jgi:pantoate kinase
LSLQGRTALSFVPGHITGLFRIIDDHEDVLYRGSLGAGFSIAAGTRTKLSVTETKRSKLTVKYNGKSIDAPVTRMVIQRMLEDYNQTLSVEVNHTSALPIGVGYGASGAGALGTALSLASLLGSKLDYEKAAQYAHCAEVLNHTGLGDVISQTAGGIEVRVKAGAPGIGRILKLTSPEDASVVLAGATSRKLKKALVDPESRHRINRSSEALIDGLVRKPTLENIVKASRQFASEAGLETPRTKKALAELSSSGYDMASMVMLGDSVFCICSPDNVSNVGEILKDFWDLSEILLTNITDTGGVVIE